MTAAIKICGVTTPEAISAVAEIRAEYVGFVFFTRSPRYRPLAQAVELAAGLPSTTRRVALLVDADDSTIGEIVAALKPGLLQLHGAETPDRARDIAAKFATPVMKVIGVGSKDDIARAAAYRGIAERIMFDAKPPKRDGALPGGNAVSFDWNILAGAEIGLPWMLAGGLTPANVADAIRISGAKTVDVSSGVESAPGVKSPELIRDFAAAVRKA